VKVLIVLLQNNYSTLEDLEEFEELIRKRKEELSK
jgi:hypothetical protein